MKVIQNLKGLSAGKYECGGVSISHVPENKYGMLNGGCRQDYTYIHMYRIYCVYVNKNIYVYNVCTYM